MPQDDVDPMTDAIVVPGNAAAERRASVPDDAEFRLLGENIPCLCWIADATGYIFWYNRRWHEYCGSTDAEMAGWGWQKVHDPAVLPEVMERWNASIQSGAPFEMTFPLRGFDGIFRPFLTRGQPLRDDDGKVIRWFGMNTDITAQIAAEEELRATNRKLLIATAEREAILSQLGEGVIITDPEGRITFVNEAATRLHGGMRLDVTPDDYTRQYRLLTLDGEPHPIEDLPLTRAVRHHETIVDARWRIARPDGTEVLAIGSARPVRGADGNLIGAVLTIRDDTARKTAEDALADASRIKDMLLHEVNHRVKNSLQLVTSLLMLQAGKAGSPELKQSLLEARTRIGVVASLHQRLYSTEEHDRVDLASYLLDLGNDTIAALDGSDRIKLAFTCTDSVFLPLDRAVPLALILSELITNAVKYAFVGDRTGTIDVILDGQGTDIAITVGDDGVGLPDGFDPSKSHGLGMRIVTALTRQVRGKLTVLRRPAGAAFLLTLPRES